MQTPSEKEFCQLTFKALCQEEFSQSTLKALCEEEFSQSTFKAFIAWLHIIDSWLHPYVAVWMAGELCRSVIIHSCSLILGVFLFTHSILDVKNVPLPEFVCTVIDIRVPGVSCCG